MALFPIGSFVELSNEVTAKVLRNNGRQHTRPIVVPLRADGALSDQELDLSNDGAPKVVAAFPEAA